MLLLVVSQKYIVITGGVLSGLGKGIVASSIARMVKARDHCVTAVKIDPYLNFDAGTLRPTEHGEVWVTADGGEFDQDLGNYERFLNQDLTKKHNITSGQVFDSVIKKERKGDYLGQTVQLIPHVTDEIKRRIKSFKEEIIVIEIGGTVGDYENIIFLEAVRQLKLEGKKVVFVHLSYIPIPGHINEAKTKPTQHSIKMLLQLGIHPDFIICRSPKELDEVRRKKISLFCNVKPEFVINDPDMKNIYELLFKFEEQNLGSKLCKILRIKDKNPELDDWKRLVNKINKPKKQVNIGIIGKYLSIGDFELKDAYISINEALRIAGAYNNAGINIKWINSQNLKINNLKELDGIIVPGGFGASGIEGKIKAVKYARENKIPYLGLCYGLHMAVIEFARNVCRLKDCDTNENNPKTKNPIITILPEQEKINEKGGTMRLGACTALLKKNSLVRKIYKKDKVIERHRHRFEVNPEYHELLEKNGLILSGVSPDKRLVEFIELRDHPFFIATQAHPEFTARLENPNPLFLSFVKACLKK